MNIYKYEICYCIYDKKKKKKELFILKLMGVKTVNKHIYSGYSYIVYIAAWI